MKSIREQLEAERNSPVPDLMLIRVLEQRVESEDAVEVPGEPSFWQRNRASFGWGILLVVCAAAFHYAMTKDAERLCSNDETAYAGCYMQGNR